MTKPELFEWIETDPDPTRVLVLGLDNIVDGGMGAALVRSRLHKATTGAIGRFDVDLLVDHQLRRPTMKLEEGRIRELEYPSLEVRRGADDAGTAFALLTGSEPDHHWRAFSAVVADVAVRLQVELVIGIGAFPSPVPHTRPTNVVAAATDDSLAAKIGFLPGGIQVPASIGSAILLACAERGVIGVGLWAQVPHYLAGAPYPAAAAALLRTMADVADLHFDTAEMDSAAEETRTRVDQLVARNPEHQAMVAKLETDADSSLAPGPLPSADELGDELEQFLRDQGDAQPPLG